MGTRRRRGAGGVVALLLAIGVGCVGVCVLAVAVLAGIAGDGTMGATCGPPQRVGATEYGGPGDPASGTVGASGVDLLTHPDSYAELGGDTFASATSLGGLPYGAELAIGYRGHSMIAYKEDIGRGGAPIDGRPRVIDLWWRLAHALGIPYEHGRWAGTVRLEPISTDCVSLTRPAPAGRARGSSTPGPLTPGSRASLLSDGKALAPASAPTAVRAMIAAGNQIAGRPYRYGGAHGLPLSVDAPYYDCSSSVAHLLYGGGALPAGGDMTSGQFARWGRPGPGRWVTIYANAVHVYMYVAGLRWDTHNAAGPDDGFDGIGWHPLVRSDAGFVVRHPAGL